MEEMKLQEPAPSNESPALAASEPHTEANAPVASTPSSPHPSTVRVPQREPGVYAPITVDAEIPAESELSDFAAFLKRTWRVWAIAAIVIVGIFGTIFTLQRLTEMARAAQLKRFDQAIASLTPEHLIARCGQAAEDVTKEVFPVVMRTVRYKPWTGEPLVFTFSRTAEQHSDWVFLTMNNESGTKSFDTPESRITAFSCLDSTK